MTLVPVDTLDMGMCDYFFRLRNDPETCMMSRRKAVPFVDHRRWWHETSDTRFIVEDGGQWVGTLRVTSDGIVSIVVDPAARGRGYGTEMLKILPKVMRKMGRSTLYAEIAPENVRSQRAFAKAGWTPVLWEHNVQ